MDDNYFGDIYKKYIEELALEFKSDYENICTSADSNLSESSFSYESIMEAYEKIKEKSKEPQLKCIVVTSLISNNDYNKYDIGNNEFVILVRPATWEATVDFCKKKDAQDSSAGAIGYLSSIPVYENDRMAFDIMTKGVFEIDVFQSLIKPFPYMKTEHVDKKLKRIYNDEYPNRFYTGV